MNQMTRPYTNYLVGVALLQHLHRNRRRLAAVHDVHRLRPHNLSKGSLAERLAELEVGSGKLPCRVERQLVLGHSGQRGALGAQPGSKIAI